MNDSAYKVLRLNLESIPSIFATLWCLHYINRQMYGLAAMWALCVIIYTGQMIVAAIRDTGPNP